MDISRPDLRRGKPRRRWIFAGILLAALAPAAAYITRMKPAAPVADPSTLVRIGDRDDCCVDGGLPEDNRYSIFAYELCLNLRDNLPEFQQLAAMEAGSGSGSLTARREGSAAVALPARRELVSGNYFHLLGIQPFKCRLIAPSEDVAGAPMLATISYQAWQRDYAGDPSVVGSTFVLNAHPVTRIGLVLAQQIAEAHGGSVRLSNRTEARGCLAELRLAALDARRQRDR